MNRDIIIYTYIFNWLFILIKISVHILYEKEICIQANVILLNPLHILVGAKIYTYY